jgi:hypothetical protein
MTKPKKPETRPPSASASRVPTTDNIETALDHYQHEKGKRASRQPPDDELMAEARREYNALLEAQAAKGKGGRPKKSATRPDSDVSEDLSNDE